MPYGYFVVEQRKAVKPGAVAEWTPIHHFDARTTLTKVMQWIEAEGKPGFYRVIQMQRAVWAEKIGGKLRLRKWHAGSPESLERGADAYERDGGKYPVVRRSRKKKS
jgi:hypothetical protein